VVYHHGLTNPAEIASQEFIRNVETLCFIELTLRFDHLATCLHTARTLSPTEPPFTD